MSRTPITAAATIGAANLDVGKKLHVKGDLPSAVTSVATQRTSVIRKRASRKPTAAARLRAGLSGKFGSILVSRLGPGEMLTQLIMHPRIGGHSRAHINTNRGGVNEHNPANTRCLQPAHMPRQRLTGNSRLQSRDQALKHHGGFT